MENEVLEFADRQQAVTAIALSRSCRSSTSFSTHKIKQIKYIGFENNKHANVIGPGV